MLDSLPSGLYEGLLCTLMISSAPTILLYFIPLSCLNGRVYGLDVLKILLSFASGGILGDVIIHAIPHLLTPHDHSHQEGAHDHHDPHNLDDHGGDIQLHHHDHHHNDDHDDHDHHHDHHHADHHYDHHDDEHHGAHEHHDAVDPHLRAILVGVLIITGFTLFLVADRMVGLLQASASAHKAVGAAKKEDGPEPESTGTGGETSRAKSRGRKRSKSRGKSRGRSKVKAKEEEGGGEEETPQSPTPSRVVAHTHAHHTHSHEVSSVWELSATGILNIVADAIHNFTDGIMIGAVFASGNVDLKRSTFLAVLLHEVPHELADFAILIQSGFSKSAAIRTQFCTAVAAFVGTLVGFFISHTYQSAEDVLVALVSGGFLYLATTNILPLTTAIVPDSPAPWIQMALDLLAFGIGVALMVAVAFLEMLSHEHGHGHHH